MGATKQSHTTPFGSKVLSGFMSFVMGLTMGGAIIQAQANVVTCANCSTSTQQGFEYLVAAQTAAEAVKTAINTAEQYKVQMDHYQYALKNGLSLPSSLYESIYRDMVGITDLYRQSQSIGRDVVNVDEKFNQLYPGYDSYLKSIGSSSQKIIGQYKTWSRASEDTARVSMNAAGFNTSLFAKENDMLNKLVAQSSTAAGHMQAVQVGNELSAQNVNQLQKLRDLIATQINMQANFMAIQTQKEGMSDAGENTFRRGVVSEEGMGGPGY